MTAPVTSLGEDVPVVDPTAGSPLRYRRPSMSRTTGVTSLALTAAALIAGMGMAHADTTYNFQSPSGNIACLLGDVYEGGVACDIAESSFAVPPHPNCPLHFGDRFLLSPGQAAVMECHGDTVRVPDMQMLGYGKTLSYRSISCTSEPAAMTCTDTASGHFFRLARDSYELH